MDGSTLQFTEKYLDIHLENPILIPVPSDDVKENLKRQYISNKKNCLTFCWIGRIADFKTPILIYTIKCLSSLALKQRINIKYHIIGEGPDESRLQKMNVNNDYFNVVFEGVISGRELDLFLLNHIDVLTAMGTSALEGAKLGIPTILLDASYGTIKGNYKFKWLFEAKSYSLADFINEKHILHENGNLDTIIEQIRNNYLVLSDKTFNYYYKNHSISVVAKLFLTAIQNASFYYCDFSKDILSKGFIRRCYEFYKKIRGV